MENDAHTAERDLRPPSLAESRRRFRELGERTIEQIERDALLSVRGQPAQSGVSTLWTPLYPVEGGPARAFRCNFRNAIREAMNFKAADSDFCNRVTRTERGMRAHLSRVHGVEQQGELF